MLIVDAMSPCTDPPLWSLQPSYTMPLLANGHSKPQLPGFYPGTLPRPRPLEHHAPAPAPLANTCSRYELRAGAQQPGHQLAGAEQLDTGSCVKSYDQLVARDSCQLEQDTEQRMMMQDSTSGSGVHHSEVIFMVPLA